MSDLGGVGAGVFANAGAAGCLGGARTPACCGDTLVAVPHLPLRRPGEILRTPDKPSPNWIIFDIKRNSRPFFCVSHPVVVRFPLPKRLAGTTQQAISLTSGGAFQALHQFRGTHLWEQQYVNMVRHYYERAKLILSKLLAAAKGIHHKAGNFLLPQEHGTRTGAVQLTIQPYKYLPRRSFTGAWERIGPDRLVQVPGDKQPAVLWVKVREAACGFHTL